MDLTLLELKTTNKLNGDKSLAESTLDLSSIFKGRMSDDEFIEFCVRNTDWRIEMTKEGDIIIMPPAYSETGRKNFNLTAEVAYWAKKDGTGIGFDSSTGFILPNTAKRSPDVSWISKKRWNALTDEQKDKFAQICPDFVIELRSDSDRLKVLREKMQEYIENGAQLGWLIDPQERKVYVYRPDTAVEILENPETVSGEPLLKDFELKLNEIW